MRECWLAHAHILYVLKYLYVVCMRILYVCLFACRDILPVSCQSQRHRVNHFEVGDRLTGGFGLCLQRKYIVPDTRHQTPDITELKSPSSARGGQYTIQGATATGLHRLRLTWHMTPTEHKLANLSE